RSTGEGAGGHAGQGIRLSTGARPVASAPACPEVSRPHGFAVRAQHHPSTIRHPDAGHHGGLFRRPSLGRRQRGSGAEVAQPRPWERMFMAQRMQVAPGTARGGGMPRLGLVLLFTAPALVLYTIYVLYPVGVSMWYSLLDWNGLAAGKFVGLSNWRRLFQDQSVLSSLRNTLIILAASFAVEMPVGLLLAVLVQRLRRLGTILS